MTEKILYPWEVFGHMTTYVDGTEGYTPTIGFVWTENNDRADAMELARLYYGRDNVHNVWESRYGLCTPPTGFVPKS